MKTYKIRVSWWNSTDIEVAASTGDEALGIAEDIFDVSQAIVETKSYEYIVDFEINDF